MASKVSENSLSTKLIVRSLHCRGHEKPDGWAPQGMAAVFFQDARVLVMAHIEGDEAADKPARGDTRSLEK